MFDNVHTGWLAGDDYQQAAQLREQEYRRALDQAGFTELSELPNDSEPASDAGTPIFDSMTRRLQGGWVDDNPGEVGK